MFSVLACFSLHTLTPHLHQCITRRAPNISCHSAPMSCCHADYRQHMLGSESPSQQQQEQDHQQQEQQQNADRPSSRGLRLVGHASEAGQQLRQDWERWLKEHAVRVGERTSGAQC